MHRVLVYRRKYLANSETFIYQQLIGHRRVKPVVLTRSKPFNLQQFPYHPIYIRKSFRGLDRWLKRQNISCLHARFGTAGVELLPVARKTRLPLIVSFHGFDATKQVNRSKRYRAQLRTLFRRSRAVTVVSRHMKRRLIRLGCPERKIVLIRSGIDLRQFPFQPSPSVRDDAFRILSVGRLTEKKGMDILIRAFWRLLRTYPRATLTIVGDGEQKGKLLRLVSRLGIRKQVTFTGALPHQEVRRAMEGCHLFVLACKTAKDGNQEGIPNVLMEAMALGRPVISTYHAGIPELITHGKNGFLVPEKAPDKLARMMAYVLSQPERWPQVTANARQRVAERHDIQKQRRKLEDLYLSVIGKAR
ncbi:colanic acid biosynthesis glycosyltransferase WcaL [Brevibacillus sp. SYP-B805]|uniref:glycosyltransferase n=1 Tax=Brevibacillus sp. SYP-B805 TaxID=1578199 RepID=UPI0013EA3A5C|nr:glycosyltransferase [Brevibacillus sp. SYP-B805]NGQ97310.1 colanic acid biosynthesis glycosyltransferase WcaL [Brevibacillus sp. SYP-B805]